MKAEDWISVKDRLPDNSDEVLINYGGDVIQAYYQSGFWKGSHNVTDAMNDGYVGDRTICQHGGRADFVTHWMPLPEPPNQ